MRKPVFAALLILIALVTLHTARAADVTVCREHLDAAFLAAYSGWDLTGDELVLTFSNIDWNAETPGYTGQAMSGTGDTSNLTVLASGGSASFGYYDAELNFVEVVGNSGTPYCDELFEGDAPSVPIAMTSDCAHVDIQDEFGHWHRVQSNGIDVLLHYGESLIAGRNQPLESERYRAVETPCF